MYSGGTMSTRRPLIYLIAGEPSGDLLGGQLVSLFKDNGWDVLGIGGERMQANGLQSLFPMEELSIIGIWGILKCLPQLLSRIDQTVKDIRSKRPDVLLTIDSPEFSFRVQKQVHRHGKNERPYQAHLVAPTVWAWRSGRAKAISRFLDHLFCLYPFEPPLFEKHGLESSFVGHPIAQEPLGDGARFRQRHHIQNTELVFCMLPGSRSSEVHTLSPIFKDAASRLYQDHANIRIVIPTLSKHAECIKHHTSNMPSPPIILTTEEERRDAFAASNLALAASGTVSMQLAHARVPMVIGYKIGPFPRSWMRIILKTPWVCMVNILLGRQAVPEFLQTDCSVNKLYDAMRKLLNLPECQVRDLVEAMKLLAPPLGTPAEMIGKKIMEMAKA